MWKKTFQVDFKCPIAYYQHLPYTLLSVTQDLSVALHPQQTNEGKWEASSLSHTHAQLDAYSVQEKRLFLSGALVCESKHTARDGTHQGREIGRWHTDTSCVTVLIVLCKLLNIKAERTSKLTQRNCNTANFCFKDSNKYMLYIYDQWLPFVWLGKKWLFPAKYWKINSIH